MKMAKYLIAFTLVASISILAFAFVPRRHEAVFFPMGGIPFKVVAYGRNSIQFDGDMAAVEVEVARLELIFNVHERDSEVSNLNSAPIVKKFPVSKDMKTLLELSKKWYHESRGAFDPTVMPLIALWKEAGKKDRPPDDSKIRIAMQRVGFDNVKILNDGIAFSKVGVYLDFGGIAKGYIIDAAVRILRGRGVRKGVVDAGGDAYAFGKGDLVLGIRDPRISDIHRIIGQITVHEEGIVTSGNYERYVRIGGKRYSHIMDPRTGMPVDNGIASVTVMGGNAANADALATALMVLGLKRSERLINSLSNYDALIIIGTRGSFKAYASKGMAKKLRMFEDWKGLLNLF